MRGQFRATVARSFSTLALSAATAALLAVPASAAAGTSGWAVVKSPNVTISGGQLESVSCSGPAACTAVGDFQNKSGITVTLAERWNGVAWQQQPVPSPANTDAGFPPPELVGVSCPTRDFCEAVGNFEQDFSTVSLAEMWNGQEWTEQSFPSPGDDDSPELSQVSCTSPTFCEAAGSFMDDNGDTVPLVAQWDGTSWTLQSTPDLDNPNGFSAISCTSPSFCEAWGGGNSEQSSGPNFAEQWDGTSWQLQTVPSSTAPVNSVSCVTATFCEAIGPDLAEGWDGTQWSTQTLPASLASANLTSVSCATRKSCETVGQVNTGNIVGAAAAWDGTAWTAQTPAEPAKATFTNLNGVSCPAAASCEAAGEWEQEATANDDKALTQTWDGNSWVLQHAAAPARATPNSLGSVSCVSATFCAAVGTNINSAGDLVNLTQLWNGRAWRIQPVPDLATQNGPSDSLDGVSCVSPVFCEAVGAGSSGAFAVGWNGVFWAEQTLPLKDTSTQQVSCPTTDFCMTVDGFADVATWNGSSWSAGTSVTGFSNASSVSCLSATFCEAVGEGPTGENAAMWNGTSWTLQATLGPVSNSLNAVSCTTVTSCEAVGQMVAPAGGIVPLAEAWDGTAWTISPAAAPAASQGSSLVAVSCTSADSCTAAGSLQSSDVQTFGQSQTLVEVWDGTTWSIPSTPDPSTAANFLDGVSCGSAAVCQAVGADNDPGGFRATLIEASSSS